MNEEKEQSVSVIKEPLESQPVRKDGRPHYLLELHKRWCRWTEIDDPDVLESLDYLSGDLFFEMRKLTSQICILNEETEKKILRKLVDNLHIPSGDKEKLRAVGEVIFEQMGKEKEALKELIDKSWRDIVDKQKVGIDKVCIVVTKHIFDKVKEKKEIVNTQSNGQEEKTTTKPKPAKKSQ